MRYTKHASLFLSALLVGASTLASCGETPDQTAMTQMMTAAHTTPITETKRISADLPARDFGGEEFTFYGRIYDGAWSANDILSHEQDGEQINDALYDRTRHIEETYNVTLSALESGEGGVTSYVKNLITAGDNTFEAVVSDVYDAGALAVENMLIDLNTVGNLDLTKEWWSQSTNGSLSIANRQFYATGDIFIIDNKATRVFFFNKGLINNYDLEDPYTLVENNEWTLDKFIEMSESVYADLNGDNAYTRDADQYGVMAQEQFGAILYFASGNLLTAKDENDLPYALCTTADAISVMTGISEKIAGMPSISTSGDSDLSGGSYPDNLVYFMDGRVLFAPEVLMHIETMRGCTVDIGILPPPKYDVNQEKYVCYADGWCVNVVSIPVTNTAPDDIGFILEAMAADSLNNLTPAYFDVVLTDKYARDEQSVRMLDLILDSVVMDNANIFAWGDIESTVADAIFKGTNIASSIEKRVKSFDKAMARTVEAIQAAGEA